MNIQRVRPGGIVSWGNQSSTVQGWNNPRVKFAVVKGGLVLATDLKPGDWVFDEDAGVTVPPNCIGGSDYALLHYWYRKDDPHDGTTIDRWTEINSAPFQVLAIDLLPSPRLRETRLWNAVTVEWDPVPNAERYRISWDRYTEETDKRSLWYGAEAKGRQVSLTVSALSSSREGEPVTCELWVPGLPDPAENARTFNADYEIVRKDEGALAVSVAVGGWLSLSSAPRVVAGGAWGRAEDIARAWILWTAWAVSRPSDSPDTGLKIIQISKTSSGTTYEVTFLPLAERVSVTIERRSRTSFAALREAAGLFARWHKGKWLSSLKAVAAAEPNTPLGRGAAKVIAWGDDDP